METKNIMIVGVGGQGTLLASKILGHVLLEQNFDVKVSEVHGMSQRGGSVVTYVRYGEKVYSPVIDKGEADAIVAFEKLEAARWISYLKKGGQIIVNTQEVEPMPVITGAAEYPQELVSKMETAGANVDGFPRNRRGGGFCQGGKYRTHGKTFEVFPGDPGSSMGGSDRRNRCGEVPCFKPQSI